MPYLQVQGHRIEYRWFGRAPAGDRPSIVLLHEGLGCIDLWREFPQRLAELTGLAVCAYSRYGYGRSEALRAPRTRDYMHAEALQTLPELLQRLGIARPILVGHSDGASIALIHAGAGRWPVRALIAMAPRVFVESLSLCAIRQAREAYETGDLKQRLARRHEDPDSAFWGWNDVWLRPEFLQWNIEACLDAIACPLLVIQGYADEYGTMEQVHRIVRRVERVEVCKLERCGHSPHRDHPETVLARIEEFLRQHVFGQDDGDSLPRPPI